MSKEVWRVREYTGLLQTNQANFQHMFRANFETGYAMRKKLNQSTIANNLSGVPGAALSILMGFASTTAGVAASIAGIIASTSGTELHSQERVIDAGTKALLRITEWLEARPACLGAQIRVAFLEYEYTDGSKARFVQGDDYVLLKIQTSSGWISAS